MKHYRGQVGSCGCGGCNPNVCNYYVHPRPENSNQKIQVRPLRAVPRQLNAIDPYGCWGPSYGCVAGLTVGQWGLPWQDPTLQFIQNQAILDQLNVCPTCYQGYYNPFGMVNGYYV